MKRLTKIVLALGSKFNISAKTTSESTAACCDLMYVIRDYTIRWSKE
jgi:hypothetical protein